MKHLISLSLFIIVFSCSSSKKTVSYESYTIPKDLYEFLMQFEKAAAEHHSQNMLNLMDTKYLKEQHDDMLKGRTDQFLNELFCGMQTNGAGFICPGFKNIKALKLIQLKEQEDSYSVTYKVQTGLNEITCELEITIDTSGKKNKFGIYGAVG